jgi:hypothetical protein
MKARATSKMAVGYLPTFHAAKLQAKVTYCITVDEATPIQIEATRDHLVKKWCFDEEIGFYLQTN